MRKLLLILSIAICGFASAQTLSPDILATSGDFFISVSSSLSWTIGEPIIETDINANNILTQGFQQSNYNITSIEENTNSVYSLFIYPNPASSFINIYVASSEIKKMRIDLTDITGKLIHTESFKNNMQLNLSGYGNAVYFICVYDKGNNFIQTYKLQKIN